MIIHGWIVPTIISMTIAVGHSIWIDWKTVMTWRRSDRSASAPPAKVRSHTGAFIANESSPIRNDDAPRVSNSQGSATCCAHVPILDNKLANQNVPKRRVPNKLKDARNVLIRCRIIFKLTIQDPRKLHCFSNNNLSRTEGFTSHDAVDKRANFKNLEIGRGIVKVQRRQIVATDHEPSQSNPREQRHFWQTNLRFVDRSHYLDHRNPRPQGV
jgi:hypothetical protein